MSADRKSARFRFLPSSLAGLALAWGLPAAALAGDTPVLSPETGYVAPDYGYPSGSAPHGIDEPSGPPVDVDWSLGLRGSYVKSSVEDYFEVRAVPQVGFVREGGRVRTQFSASAEIARPSDNNARLALLRATLGVDYRLDQQTIARFTGDLSLSQPSASDPGVGEAVSDPARTLSGRVGAELERGFGRFDLALRGGLERNIYGDTGYTDGTWRANTANNRWAASTGLRLSYKLTPILSPFVDGQITRDFYDAAISGTSTFLDGDTIELKTGLSGKWPGGLSAEASVGWGLRRFADGSLGDVTAQLYNAQLTYQATRALSVGAGFTTSFQPPTPDSPGTTRVQYMLDGSARYTVNDWLGLRAAANWRHVDISPDAQVERGYGYSLGADYQLSRHSSLNAEYEFDRSEPVSDPARDTHRVTMGLTVKR